jgi:prepilin-type N-terminal cleavage/methylation domain-containing protein
MSLRPAANRASLHTSSEDGFTLIELMTVMFIMAILLTMGGFAIRQFWFVRSLSGSQDQVAVQLRQLQQRVVAETHPLVYGARFFEGDKSFGLIRFDPETNTCVQYQTVNLGRGVEIDITTDLDSESTEPFIFCSANLAFSGGGSVPNAASSEYAFFFARGNGTPGLVRIHSEPLDRFEAVEVAGITGRVDEV